MIGTLAALWLKRLRHLLLAMALMLLSACARSVSPAATPTGALLSREQAVEMGRSICASSRVHAQGEPRLASAELTTNQAIAARLGRPTWGGLPPDSPIWLVKFSGVFTIPQPPAGGGTPASPQGPFPACWAIIEARTGARGTVYIPNP